MAKDALETVRAVAERVAAARGDELVDIELKRQRDGAVLRLYLDRPGGISLDELTAVAEEVSAILDVEDPISSAYTLEVSSPGLDRPLKNEVDFRRALGQLARLSSYEPLEGRRHWVGRLLDVADGHVSLRLEKEGGAEARLPLAKIAHARLEVEFPSAPKPNKTRE